MKYQKLKKLVNDFEKYKRIMEALQISNKTVQISLEREKAPFIFTPINYIDVDEEPILLNFIYSYFNTKLGILRKQVYNIELKNEEKEK